MAELTQADLRELPSSYQSPRPVGDVLIGEDTGLPLIKTSSDGDVTALQAMLEQSPEVALASLHRIYYQERPANDEKDARKVYAMPRSNLYQALLRAAENGHATVVSTLLDFGSRNGLKASDIIDRVVIKNTVENGHAAVFEVLAKADPTVTTHDDFQGKLPLDLAMASNHIEVAKLILKHGGGHKHSFSTRNSSYSGSRLCRAVRVSSTDMIKLLLQHGYVVKGSGALQMAASRGALDAIRLLVEEHGADVNEQLPAEGLPRVDNALYVSWRPLHFAARSGREEAMELLESYGAKPDALDANGKTALQLLEDRKEAIQNRQQSTT